MNFPLVTIGVASYNNAPYLSETLDSLRDIDYPNLQLVVVDDASRDDSVTIIEQWQQNNPQVDLTFIAHETNRGICRALNQVLEVARGEFFAYVGSDDTLLPQRIRQQVAVFASLPDTCGVVFSDVAHMDSTGRPLPPPADLTAPHSGQVFSNLLEVNYVPAMAALIRRSCFDKVGLYDESLSYEDWDMWLRLAREFEFQHVPGVVARYRIHAGSATSSRRVQLAEGSLQLLSKHLGISSETNVLIGRHFAGLAETLYLFKSPRAIHWLQKAWQLGRRRRVGILLLLARLGVSLVQVHTLNRRLRAFSGGAAGPA